MMNDVETLSLRCCGAIGARIHPQTRETEACESHESRQSSKSFVWTSNGRVICWVDDHDDRRIAIATMREEGQVVTTHLVIKLTQPRHPKFSPLLFLQNP